MATKQHWISGDTRDVILYKIAINLYIAATNVGMVGEHEPIQGESEYILLAKILTYTSFLS